VPRGWRMCARIRVREIRFPAEERIIARRSSIAADSDCVDHCEREFVGENLLSRLAICRYANRESRLITHRLPRSANLIHRKMEI
jgi:hypothetical protein